MTKGASFEETLGQLFDAEREARRLHDALAQRARGEDRAAFLAALRVAMEEAEQLEEGEASLRLVSVARLLGEMEGADVADMLVDTLASAHAEARHEAGEQLQGLAFDRFKEVALAAERALERLGVGSPALVELPYVLVEVPEPGVVKVLGKFLKHEDAEAVASAIEALAEVADPSAVKELEALEGDSRTTTVGDDGEEQAEVTLGELAKEAIELLSRPEDG